MVPNPGLGVPKNSTGKLTERPTLNQTKTSEVSDIGGTAAALRLLRDQGHPDSYKWNPNTMCPERISTQAEAWDTGRVFVCTRKYRRQPN